MKLIIYHLSYIIHKSRGFTLIELMVAVSVTAVLGTFGIAAFVNYNQSQVFQTSVNEVVSMLNLAKSRAQSQVRLGSTCKALSLEGYGVGISSSDRTYSLKIYCPRPTEELLSSKTLPQNVNFVSSASFFFPVQKGGAEVGGNFSISSGGKTKTIEVNSLGIVKTW